MSHTPGPWTKSGPLFAIFTEGDAYGGGDMHIADIRGWGHLTGRGGGCAMDEEKAIGIQRSNADLIAAAPDLHEVARLLIKYCSKRDGTLANYSDWLQCFVEDGSTITEVVEKAVAALAKAEGQ